MSSASKYGPLVMPGSHTQKQPPTVKKMGEKRELEEEDADEEEEEDQYAPQVEEMTSKGMIHLGNHEVNNETTGVFYNVDKAINDVHHAKLNSRYFGMSAYFLCAVGCVLRLFSFFAALAVGGLALAELMILFIWVEPLVVFCLWTKHLGLLWLAFCVTLISLLAKIAYLLLWIFSYWHFVNETWYWVIFSVVIAYSLVTLSLLLCIINVLKAKFQFSGIVNDMEKLSDRIRLGKK